MQTLSSRLSTPNFPFHFFCTLFNALLFFSSSLSLSLSRLNHFSYYLLHPGRGKKRKSGGTSNTSSHHLHPCKLRALSSSCKICIATHLPSLVILFIFFLPGTHFMQVTIPSPDTHKKDHPHFFALSFTFLALLEDNRMEAVISAVWPFAFIGTY